MANNRQKLNISIESIGAIFIIIFVSAFILLNFFAGFILPVYLLTMAIAFFISLFYPRSGLFAIIFLTVIFERFFTLLPVFLGKIDYKIYPLDIILLAIFLSIIIQFISRVLKFKKIKKADYFLLGFIFLNVIYFLYCIFISKADSILAFSVFKNYAFYPFIFFASYFLIQKKEDIERLFKFFLAGAVPVIGFIIFGIMNGNGLWTEFTPLSTEGVRILAFTHGLYLSLAFVSVLAYLVFKNNSKSIFFWISVIWIIGIVGSMMRHLWIAIILALILIYIKALKKEKMIFRNTISGYFLVLFLALAFVFYAVFMLPESKFSKNIESISGAVIERSASIGKSKNDESFSWRKLAWLSAYKEFEQKPIFGIGTGTRIYIEKEDYRDYVEVKNLHNSYISILIQFGILGLGIFLLFFYQILKNVFKNTSNGDRFYKFSIIGCLLIFAISFCFQPYLETNLLSIFFWISAGLARKFNEINFE